MLSIYCTTSLIFISNFRLLVLQFYHIFDFFLVPLHFNIIFPEACTKILLLYLTCYALQALFVFCSAIVNPFLNPSKIIFLRDI